MSASRVLASSSACSPAAAATQRTRCDAAARTVTCEIAEGAARSRPRPPRHRLPGRLHSARLRADRRQHSPARARPRSSSITADGDALYFQNSVDLPDPLRSSPSTHLSGNGLPRRAAARRVQHDRVLLARSPLHPRRGHLLRGPAGLGARALALRHRVGGDDRRRSTRPCRRTRSSAALSSSTRPPTRSRARPKKLPASVTSGR